MSTSTPRVLIVEDEPVLAQGLAEALGYQGYECDIAPDGQDGLHKARRGHYDVMLLDIMLPHLSGFEVIETLRQEDNKTPTIILTAKGAEEDRVRGLELGADDYVTKPFAIAELVARVAAQVRRARMDRGDGETFESDGLRFDLGRLTATRGEDVIHLTPREGEILAHISQSTGVPLSKSALGMDEFTTGVADSGFTKAPGWYSVPGDQKGTESESPTAAVADSLNVDVP